jgi:phosphoribosylformylglycinamidine cyclo-ligase
LDDLERTLNMGVGFVAVLPAAQAERALEVAAGLDLPGWVLGAVSELATATIDDAAEVVRGAKGVAGGAVQVVGAHPA